MSQRIEISYGTSFTTSGSTWGDSLRAGLIGGYTINEDQDAFSVSFRLAVEGDDESDVKTRHDTLVSYLSAENQRIIVQHGSVGGVSPQRTHYYTPILADVDTGAGIKCAQFTRAEWDLIPEAMTLRTRIYRITLTATKPAIQTGKIGKRSQSIRLTVGADNLKELEVVIDFTPDADGSTAREVFADATNGFAARVTAIKTALSVGETDNAPILTEEDEDSRTLTARAVYREVPFPQSASPDGSDSLDESTLVDPTYSVRAIRRAGSGASLPGLENARPPADFVVSFSAGVKYEGSQLDLDSVIVDTVLPYVESTLASRLQKDADAAVMGHTLTVQDLPRPRVSGEVLFLVAEGGLLGAQVIEVEQRRRGVAYQPVLNGDELAVDEHIGPGLHLAQVTVVTEELGQRTRGLERALRTIRASYKKKGFVELGDDSRVESSVRNFVSPYDALARFTTTTGQAVVYFRKVNIRSSRTSTGGAGVIGRTRTS
ncbi:MAG TPA: hypothetical protein DEA08_19675 [Planctomycetes bacterium]|nr:hypothetical protein [Planctomycetota bacterium]